jgi:hypothetical protein
LLGAAVAVPRGLDAGASPRWVAWMRGPRLPLAGSRPRFLAWSGDYGCPLWAASQSGCQGSAWAGAALRCWSLAMLGSKAPGLEALGPAAGRLGLRRQRLGTLAARSGNPGVGSGVPGVRRQRQGRRPTRPDLLGCYGCRWSVAVGATVLEWLASMARIGLKPCPGLSGRWWWRSLRHSPPWRHHRGFLAWRKPVTKVLLRCFTNIVAICGRQFPS